MSKAKTDWGKCAIHRNDEIVKNLCLSIVINAVNDWVTIRRKGDCAKVTHDYVYRFDVTDFFNSSFFRDILETMAPDIDQEYACERLKHFDKRFVSLSAETLKGMENCFQTRK